MFGLQLFLSGLTEWRNSFWIWKIFHHFRLGNNILRMCRGKAICFLSTEFLTETRRWIKNIYIYNIKNENSWNVAYSYIYCSILLKHWVSGSIHGEMIPVGFRRVCHLAHVASFGAHKTMLNAQSLSHKELWRKDLWILKHGYTDVLICFRRPCTTWK